MNNKAVAGKLLQLRGQAARKTVADAVGISVSALGMYENGRRTPRDEIKRRLADYYGVGVEGLFFNQ